MCCIAWLAKKFITFEAQHNSRGFGTVTDTVAAKNHFTTCDLLKQCASFNVLCQRHTANGHTLHLCSGWTTGPHTVPTLRGMGRGVSTLRALKVAILLLHSPQTLLADEVQAAQEVGVF